MASVGEIALGAFLQVVFDKLASREMLYFFRRESIRTQVMNWETTLREIRAVLDDAEEKQITSKFVNLCLEELQDLAYDLDDLLDEFSTEALREMIEKSQSTTNKIRAYFRTFMRLNLGDAIFDSNKSKHLHLPRRSFQWQFDFKLNPSLSLLSWKMLLELVEGVTVVYAELIIQVSSSFNLSWLCPEEVLVDACCNCCLLLFCVHDLIFKNCINSLNHLPLC